MLTVRTVTSMPPTWREVLFPVLQWQQMRKSFHPTEPAIAPAAQGRNRDGVVRVKVEKRRNAPPSFKKPLTPDQGIVVMQILFVVSLIRPSRTDLPI